MNINSFSTQSITIITQYKEWEIITTSGCEDCLVWVGFRCVKGDNVDEERVLSLFAELRGSVLLLWTVIACRDSFIGLLDTAQKKKNGKWKTS